MTPLAIRAGRNLAVALPVVTMDQASKRLAARALARGELIAILPFANLRLGFNKGVSFGLLPAGSSAGVAVLIGVTGVTNLAGYVDRSGKALRDLRAEGLPTTLLLDREGRELGRVIGPDEYDTPDWVERIEQFRRAGRGCETRTLLRTSP
jgi:hypothetical protein